MTEQHFTAQLERSGSNTFIPLPFNPVEVWGTRERYHVTGSVNGITVRAALRANGSQFRLPLGPAWLRDNPIDPGATVDVVLAPEGPQAEQLASDVAAALAAEPQAKTFFEALPTFYRKNYMRWLDSAKRAETRAARIAEMVELLKAGKRER